MSPKTILPGVASALCPSPSGQYLVVAVRRDLFLWQLSSGALLRHLRGCHFQSVTSIRFSQDGCHLVTASEDGGVSAWTLLDLVALGAKGRSSSSDPTPREKWNDHQLKVTGLLLSGSGCSVRIFSCSLAGSVKVCIVFSCSLESKPF